MFEVFYTLYRVIMIYKRDEKNVKYWKESKKGKVFARWYVKSLMFSISELYSIQIEPENSKYSTQFSFWFCLYGHM